MKKEKITPNDMLVGLSYLMTTFNQSRSTINRHINAGLLPRPDVPAHKIGSCNKWLKSNVDNVLKEKIEGVEK